jgi:hypothetical protein
MKFQKTEVKILSEINVKLKNGENEKNFSGLEEFENEIKKELEKENVQEISVISNEDYGTGDDLETPYFNEKLFKIANYAPNFSYENRKLFLERKDGKIKITFGYTEIVDAQLETFFEKYINVYGNLFEKDGEFDLEKGYIYADYECDRLKTLFEIFVEMSNGKAGYETRLIERESEARYDGYYLEIEKLNSDGQKTASFVITRGFTFKTTVDKKGNEIITDFIAVEEMDREDYEEVMIKDFKKEYKKIVRSYEIANKEVEDKINDFFY